MIYSHPYMKKHRVLLDISNNFVSFLIKYYTHSGAFLCDVDYTPKKFKKIA